MGIYIPIRQAVNKSDLIGKDGKQMVKSLPKLSVVNIHDLLQILTDLLLLLLVYLQRLFAVVMQLLQVVQSNKVVSNLAKLLVCSCLSAGAFHTDGPFLKMLLHSEMLAGSLVRTMFS